MTSDTTYANDSYNYSPDEYVSPGQVILPTPGNVVARITNFAARVRDGQIVVDSKGFKTISLNRVEILEPTENAGTYALFQDLRCAPFPIRKGSDKLRSNASDLVRAIDREQDPGNFLDAQDVLLELLAQPHTFRAFLSYTGTDTDWAKATIEANGYAKDSADKDKVTGYYDTWRNAEMKLKDFKNPDGTYRTQTPSRLPGGKAINARLRLTTFYVSDQDVQIGQD